MTDINNFKQIMKQWITVDDQIRVATRELKLLRNERTQLTNTACEIIQTNKWESRKIEAADSQITFAFKKDYPALTFAFLEKHLAEIIPNADDITKIILHLKSKREPKNLPDLKRRHNNRVDGGYETE